MTIFGYRAEAAKHGPKIVNQLLTFEAAALQQYAAIVKKEDIDCDMHVTRAFDVCFRKEDAEAGKKDYEARKAAWGEDMAKHDLRVVEDPKELEALTGVRGGYWGASYPAGHLWPYKLASACKPYPPCLCVKMEPDKRYSNTHWPKPWSQLSNPYARSIS